MTSGILTAVGGLGVFLLGMIVMTDGLKAIAGESLRRALATFTKSPTSGAVTGAISTAIIQSSSATTVTAVGFVGAGLISFTQALGIIFGANIGTTITGWLVAIVGFKLKIGELALPFVLFGVLIHIFSRRKLSAFGMALAGFGVIFLGIDLIQSGMAGLKGVVTPDTFPGDHLGGRFLLLLIGICITLVTQSSSAGVATALTAVHAGSISFEQAAVMVIGMDVGTTATAALATIGGSTDVRRTGFAHVIYNLLTGVMAFLLVTPYSWFCESLFPEGFQENPEIALAGFHTFFNTLGVIAVLPFAGAFAKLMIWLVPDEPLKLAQRLDRSLYQSPGAAMDAVNGTLQELSIVVFEQLHEILTSGPSDGVLDSLEAAKEALKKTREYVAAIETTGIHEHLHSRKEIAIHTIDHLRRLIARSKKFKRSERTRLAELKPLSDVLVKAVSEARTRLEMDDPAVAKGDDSVAEIKSLENIWQSFETETNHYRKSFVSEAAAGKSDTHSTIRNLDTLRWIRRVSYHIWRIVFYLTVGKKSDDHEKLLSDDLEEGIPEITEE